MLYVLVTILDPRCKTKRIECLISTIVENLVINMKLTIDDARKMVKNLFELYKKIWYRSTTTMNFNFNFKDDF